MDLIVRNTSFMHDDGDCNGMKRSMKTCTLDVERYWEDESPYH